MNQGPSDGGARIWLKDANAQTEVDRAGAEGSSLVSLASAAGGAVLGYLTGLSAIGKTLADAIADGLNGENQTLADAVKAYAVGVAGKEKGFAVDMADAVAAHDKEVTLRTTAFKDSQSTRQRTRDDAVDHAQWVYERLAADLVKSLAEANAMSAADGDQNIAKTQDPWIPAGSSLRH